MQCVATILWRRLDAPGHDACRLERHPDGWVLEGAAVYMQPDGTPAHVAYRLHADHAWHTRWGSVKGWLGQAAIEHSIERDAQGEWRLDGRVPGLHACIDLDLGFTPASNLMAIRRLHLDAGAAGRSDAAWLDLDHHTLSLLQQRYRRRGDAEYEYEAPRFGYAATLCVTADGFVADYPGLWRAETPPAASDSVVVP